MSKAVLGWWFAASDVLPHGDGRKIVIGQTLRVKPPIVLCERGLHASRRAIDALNYARGPFLYRVRLSDQVVHGLVGGADKMVATERTALWRIDATRALRLFACDVAEMALRAERAAGREPHKESWDVVGVARRYLDGKATVKELGAAWSAASASSAARSAAWSAASAWSAARNAAWSAAESAASASSAASSAAESAAMNAAEKLLLRRIREAHSASRTGDAP